MFHHLLGILFPKLCIGCNRSLLKNEEAICTSCVYDLPRTHYHAQKDNPLEKTFWGRVPIERAFSFLYFKKGNITQRILHELKYKGDKELGTLIGRMYASELKDHIQPVDAVVAIPLHSSKLRKRGYNQSDLFAEGLAQQLNITNMSASVTRKMATETQTKKSRFERWENVAEVFEIKHPEAFTRKHILLVDDVVTTGATIEACATALLQVPFCKISVASIAITSV
jgi:ComF family protein